MAVFEQIINGDEDMRFKSGLNYRSLGKFFEFAISRRGLSVRDVSEKTSLNEEDVVALIEDKKRFDKLTSRKLKPLFPKTYRYFEQLQTEIDQMNPEKIKHLKAKAPKPNIY